MCLSRRFLNEKFSGGLFVSSARQTSMGCGQSRVSAASESAIDSVDANNKIEAISENEKTTELVRLAESLNGYEVHNGDGVHHITGGILGK